MDEYGYALIGKNPVKRARKGRYEKSTPLGICVVEVYHLPRVEHPEWGRRCGFCGSCNHLYYREGEPFPCPHAKCRLLADGFTMSYTIVCTYSKCTIHHLHVTKVCPILHHLCNVCGLWAMLAHAR